MFGGPETIVQAPAPVPDRTIRFFARFSAMAIRNKSIAICN